MSVYVVQDTENDYILGVYSTYDKAFERLWLEVKGETRILETVYDELIEEDIITEETLSMKEFLASDCRKDFFKKYFDKHGLDWLDIRIWVVDAD